jgi:glycosyltransferase involved in cell wall biosynthesis
MIKIFYVIDSFDMGGAQRQLLEVMRGLNPRRYQAVVCPLWPLMALEADYQQTGWPIIRVHKRSQLDVSVIWRLAREMRAFRPHLVHTWLFTGNLWGRLAAALARVPGVIASERTVVPKEKSRQDGSFFNCILAGVSDIITANSQEGLREIQFVSGITAPALKVIYNGVDLEHFNNRRVQSTTSELRKSLGIESDSLILGNIGRLTEQKGQDVLLQAARLLVHGGKNLKVVIVGGGPRRQELDNLAEKLGLHGSVLFLGPRSDIPQLLSLFDIFVLPSRWEGFPNVVLEAMAMAKAVVATDVAGVSELVEHEVTGLLVKSGDPHHLAQAIRRLMDAPALAAQMGVAGRQRVERHFSVEGMVAETTNLYDDLLRQKGIRP